jgi:hypothetical protein
MLLKQQSRLALPQVIARSEVRNYRIAPDRHLRKIVGPSSWAVDDELAQARVAWKQYQSTRRRDAVYDYLRAVFKIVRGWRNEHRATASSHHALKATGRANMIRRVEPFATVILCTSDPREVEAKTRSKWARALQFAQQSKPTAQSLGQYIKDQGGINECAARFER